MKVIILVWLCTLIVCGNSATCKQRCNDEFGVGGVLKHQVQRVDCYYAPFLGCITYKLIERK